MWDSEYKKIRDQYSKLSSKYQDKMEECRRECHLPFGLWEELTEVRLFENGLSYKGEDGLIYLAAALEGISHGLIDGGINASLISHLGLGLNTIKKYCHDDIRDHYLDLVINQNHLLAFSVSEPHGGSNPQKLDTRLIPANDGYILDGKKWLVTNGPKANSIIVLCQEQLSNRATAVLVGGDWKGVEKRIITPLGLKTSPLAQISFNEVFVPKTHVLGNIGDGANILNEAFMRERLLVPFGCIGNIERILDTLIEYSQERKISNHAIADHQYIRKRLTDIAINLETIRGIAHMGLLAFKAKENLSLYASICKHYASNRAIDSCINAIQIMGSYGLLENSVGEHLLSAIGSTIGGGTEEIHREEIYAGIYRRYRKNKRLSTNE